MTKHYEQRKEANKRYLAKFEEVRIRITKEEKDELKRKELIRNQKLYMETLNHYIKLNYFDFKIDSYS